ncbi:hypothetical protein OEW28_08725 [Defluviimonas sp. WL0002]|uniref:Uncharacterized protein n=1 Tax=Albidovulum marisflavi TaxID=2984159 RepID=A0ABT2ZD89_9RHOB|nr:hypothetical protein [Defluviimonas sp. WL0002]MCV2868711.1 hypothetical protein [Defluviimonas sp. WL0002]
MDSYFPDARLMDAADTDALVRALEGCAADWVFVMGPDLLPYSTLPGARPDHLHIAKRRPVRFLSRNSVTGEFDAEHGPELWPCDLLLRKASQWGAAPDVSLVPQAMAQWYVNATGETTFRNAHASISARLAMPGDAQARRELEISASLGADAPHGYAWIAGACAALLGLSEQSAAWIEDAEAARLAAADSARRVRLETDFEVRVLTPGECRIIRDLCFQMPPAQIYGRAAKLAEDGTKEGDRNARILRAAGDWLWLGQYPPD